MTGPGYSPVIVWFRRDLRISDHPALFHATRRGPTLPVFIAEQEPGAPWTPARGLLWWQAQSLRALRARLGHVQLPLLLRQGDPSQALIQLVQQVQARAVFWNEAADPALWTEEKRVRKNLEDQGTEVQVFQGNTLLRPGHLLNSQGHPFRVFTPFWRRALDCIRPEAPLGLPSPHHEQNIRLASSISDPASEATWQDIEARARSSVQGCFNPGAVWSPGEKQAQKLFRHFLDHILHRYPVSRDIPAEQGTSRLSPHIHHGEISMRQMWHGLQQAGTCHTHPGAADKFLSEQGWLLFARDLLFHTPHMTHRPLRPEFEHWPWSDNPAGLEAWQQGRTGYPLVDAGMRELACTGWMHNRVRMVTGSFLTRHLLVSWTRGAEWFGQNLVDADRAANSTGWQWVAGCGVDTVPWFRIFNPVLQGQKHDPQGEYIRKWIPELAKIPREDLHTPWRSCTDWPRPVVDLAESRKRALAVMATEGLKQGS